MAASATTNAMLPPRAAAVAMKTPAAEVMGGHKQSTINYKHGNGNNDSNDNDDENEGDMMAVEAL